MTDVHRSPATEAAVNALQEAVLLTDHLRHDHIDDFAKLKAALERAIAALQPEGGRRV